MSFRYFRSTDDGPSPKSLSRQIDKAHSPLCRFMVSVVNCGVCRIVRVRATLVEQDQVDDLRVGRHRRSPLWLVDVFVVVSVVVTANDLFGLVVAFFVTVGLSSASSPSSSPL